jgi:hypothetical protein
LKQYVISELLLGVWLIGWPESMYVFLSNVDDCVISGKKADRHVGSLSKTAEFIHI